MTLIVNLSTTHDYSIDETIGAFVQLCNQHSSGCLQSTPKFFQNSLNYAWVKAKLYSNYPSLIEPYKLGNMNTEQFLDNLSQIFYFMNDMDKIARHKLLADAWSSSIKLSAAKKDRLAILLERGQDEPIYFISNTNELDVGAILNLFREKNPNLTWNDVDISINDTKEPIEILPNVYLCLSYRFKTFKTMTLIEELSKKCLGPITLVSQYQGDLDKGKSLNLDSFLTTEEFYNFDRPTLLSKKQQ